MKAEFQYVSPLEMRLSPDQVKALVTLLRMQFMPQTPTPVIARAGEVDRVNLTMPADAYGYMMHLLNEAGGWEMSAEDKVKVTMHFLKKAGENTDLKTWSMGELEAALEDVETAIGALKDSAVDVADVESARAFSTKLKDELTGRIA